MIQSQNIIIAYHRSDDATRLYRNLVSKTGESWTTMTVRSGMGGERERVLTSQVINNMYHPRVCWLLGSPAPAGYYALWPVRVPLALVQESMNRLCLN